MKFHDDLNIPESHQHPWTTCTFSTWQNNKLELPMSQPGRVWAPKENHRLRLSPLIRKRINSSFGACLNLESFGVVRGRGTKRPSYLAEIITSKDSKDMVLDTKPGLGIDCVEASFLKWKWECEYAVHDWSNIKVIRYGLLSTWYFLLKSSSTEKNHPNKVGFNNLQLHLSDLEISIDISNW